MKALKIIGLAALVVGLAGAIAAGGYFLALWHGADKEQSNNTNTSQNTTNTPDNTRPAHEHTPPKPTALTTCNADELTLAAEPSSDSGAGTVALALTLTNSGNRECILGGYPGVSLVNDNGNMIGKPADRTTNVAEKTVTLQPGAKATATVYAEQEGNFDSGVCAEGATKIRVYPPNDTGYLSVAQTTFTAWCPGFMTTPVQ